MTPDFKELLSIVNKYGLCPSIAEDRESVVLSCRLNNDRIPVAIYLESTNFQINIGRLLVLDKIEEQDLASNDFSDMLDNFCSSLVHEKISIVEHSLFGRKTYSLATLGEVNKHVEYETVVGAFLKKIGRSRQIGTLIPEC